MSNIYRIFTIYRCVNLLNGKCYIGFASNWPKRQRDHKRSHLDPKKSTKFYHALSKYGWNNFQWDIIYQSKELCQNPKQSHTLNVMEPFFIKEYDSIENGYNTTLGGDCGPICKGSKNGMWQKTHTKKVKEKLSKVAKERFENKTYEELYGKEKAITLKKLRSEISKGKNHSYKNNPRFDSTLYSFYNIETGIILKCTRYTFHKNHKISNACINGIINNLKIYKKWCIIF